MKSRPLNGTIRACAVYRNCDSKIGFTKRKNKLQERRGQNWLIEWREDYPRYVPSEPEETFCCCVLFRLELIDDKRLDSG